MRRAAPVLQTIGGAPASAPPGEQAVQVLSLQPVAIIDHVCILEEEVLKQLVADELGGSHRVELEEVRPGGNSCALCGSGHGPWRHRNMLPVHCRSSAP